MHLNLNGLTALVTASTGGIGLEIARSLAIEGARVIVNGRTQSNVEKALTELRRDLSSADLVGLAADNGTAGGCATTLSTWPQVDILVNNLGIYEAIGFFDETDGAWQKMFEINIMSGVRLARQYLPGSTVSQGDAGTRPWEDCIHFERIGDFPRAGDGSLQRHQDDAIGNRPLSC